MSKDVSALISLVLSHRFVGRRRRLEVEQTGLFWGMIGQLLRRMSYHHQRLTTSTLFDSI
jgi:hypothetical protein